MSRLSGYFLPAGIRRLWKPAFIELKLFVRVWLNFLLPHKLVRYRRMLRKPCQNIHLGCGSKIFEGWTNIDMNPKGDVTLDLREGLPFRDGSVQLIYSEHTFEHFYREHDGPFLLTECYRCLQPGGRIRITVPDGAAFIDYYVGRLDAATTEALRSTHARFHGTRMDVVNSGFRWKHQHFYMYDEETLRQLLEEVGFVEVQRQEFRQSYLDQLGRLDSEQRRVGTLYMDARKPPDDGRGAVTEGPPQKAARLR